MFEAYSVGIRVSLINGVSAGLVAMAKQFRTAHTEAGLLASRINEIKRGMLIGGALTAAGGGLFWLISKTLPAAKEYAHQLALMNTAGMKQVEIARSQKAAFDALKTAPTSSLTENLAAIRELRMVFGNTNDAISNMPIVQQLQAILAVQHGGDMGRGRDDAYTVAKALEMRGAVRSPAEFNAQADAIAKAITASGGKVGPADFLSAFKYGRTATTGWSDAFAYTILPTLIQEMKTSGGSGGAGGPGNALMSAYAAVVGGKIPQNALGEWQRLGLLDPSKVVRTKTGSTKGLLPGGIVGSDLFQSNPYLWAQTILNPAMARVGITDPAKQRQTLQYLFPNRTAGFIMTQMSTQGWKFQRDQGMIQGALGLGAYQQLLKTDPYMAQLALQKSVNSLFAILGTAVLPDLVKVMVALVPWIQDLTKFLGDHPHGLKTVMRGLVALATLLTASGIATTLVSMFKAFGLVFTVLRGGAAALPVVAGGLEAVGGGVAALAASPLVVVAGLLTALAAAVWLLPRALKAAADAMGIKDDPDPSHHYGGRGGPGVRGSPYVSPYSPHVQRVLNGVVYLDGRRVGRIVGGQMVKDAAGPAAGPATFDANRHMPVVGQPAG